MPNAVFAGSFDPPTSGHLDVIESAVSIFDMLYVVVAHNPEKDGLFSIDERMEMLNAMNSFGDRMRVFSWEGLVTDFARNHQCTVLVRGLRNASELPYESTMAYMNRRLAPNIKTVFFSTMPSMSISALVWYEISCLIERFPTILCRQPSQKCSRIS